MIQFRKGTEMDIDGCLSVNMSLRLPSSDRPIACNVLEQRGFLLPSEKESYSALIKHGTVLVAACSDSIVGYMSAFSNHSPLFDELKATEGVFNWVGANPLDRALFMWVNGIGVLPQYRRRGVAIGLFRMLQRESFGHDLLTAVAEYPFNNLRSAAVLRGLRFQRVGEFRAAEFCGLPNYKGGIYIREAP